MFASGKRSSLFLASINYTKKKVYAILPRCEDDEGNVTNLTNNILPKDIFPTFLELQRNLTWVMHINIVAALTKKTSIVVS